MKALVERYPFTFRAYLPVGMLLSLAARILGG